MFFVLLGVGGLSPHPSELIASLGMRGMREHGMAANSKGSVWGFGCFSQSSPALEKGNPTSYGGLAAIPRPLLLAFRVLI